MPQERDLAGLPYFAILVLGARNARYVEHLFKTWQGASSEQVDAVASAIKAIEDLAGYPDAAARAPHWGSATNVALLACDAATAADCASAPAAALLAADSAAELADAIDPDRGRTKAARAVLRSIHASASAIEHSNDGDNEEFLAQIGRDVENLRAQASSQGWTDDTGVSMQVLDS